MHLLVHSARMCGLEMQAHGPQLLSPGQSTGRGIRFHQADPAQGPAASWRDLPPFICQCAGVATIAFGGDPAVPGAGCAGQQPRIKLCTAGAACVFSSAVRC